MTMPYNNQITRGGASALVPEDVSSRLLDGVERDSVVLSRFPSVRMSSAQTRMPVLAALPTAYFVAGDTGLKQTTDMAWDNKYLNVEELAVIVPIPEAVLDDANYDIFGSVEPKIVEALGRAIDAAVFFGTNKPASWPTAIVPAAAAAGNTVAVAATAANGGYAKDISDTFATVEADGFDVNAMLAARYWRGRLRNVRDTTGNRVAEISNSVSSDSAFGVDIDYPMRGMWPAQGGGNVGLIAGDFSQGIVGLRQDITYKILDQAVLQDQAGAIQYNLAQQDMVALRVVTRLAFQIANLLNFDQPTEANRYPFATLTG